LVDAPPIFAAEVVVTPIPPEAAAVLGFLRSANASDFSLEERVALNELGELCQQLPWQATHRRDETLLLLQRILGVLDPPAPTEPPAEQPNNELIWEGEAWRIRYQEGDDVESGIIEDTTGVRVCAKIIDAKRIDPLDLYPPPPGVASLKHAHLGQDDRSDAEAFRQYKERLSELVSKIEEADDSKEAARLKQERDDLNKFLKAELVARKRGHRLKCGKKSLKANASEGVDQNKKRLVARLRKAGLPKLADHLHDCLKRPGGWHYAPTANTLPWTVTLPPSS
jgi:hypothetical protein